MKIVFLDVDGELTYSNYRNKETENIDTEKVKLLKEICDRTGAKVVISSTWRGTDDFTPNVYFILIKVLKDNGIDVLGDLPYIETEFIESIPENIAFDLDDLPDLKMKHGTGRAAEVQKWLLEHEVESFVILDDEDFDWVDYGYDKYWVRPTWFGDGGLHREHVEQAVKILKNGVKNDFK